MEMISSQNCVAFDLLLSFIHQRSALCNLVYDDFPASLYVFYRQDAICNDVVSYKQPCIRTMVAAVYFQLGMLLTQTAQQDSQGAMLHGTVRHMQKQRTRHILSLHQVVAHFWAGLAELSTDAHFVLPPDGDTDFQSIESFVVLYQPIGLVMHVLYRLATLIVFLRFKT